MPKLLSKVLVFVLIMAMGVFAAPAIGTRSFQQRDETASDRTVDYSFEVLQLQYSGETFKSAVTIKGERNSSPSHMMLMKRQALMLTQLTSSLGESHNFLVAYIAPDALDGQAVDRDAVIKELPRPRFWRDEYGHPSSWSKHLHCNLMVYVTLHSSSKVSEVTVVSNQYSRCDKQSDVLEAAKSISFEPALRDGQPITQRQLFLYRLH
ncbi:MAG TPA: hypothetical protein DC054_07065 [Blastocatellia bacterium]|nr:hypothetical protein [Blastocatellia bacterium]